MKLLPVGVAVGVVDAQHLVLDQHRRHLRMACRPSRGAPRGSKMLPVLVPAHVAPRRRAVYATSSSTDGSERRQQRDVVVGRSGGPRRSAISRPCATAKRMISHTCAIVLVVDRGAGRQRQHAVATAPRVRQQQLGVGEVRPVRLHPVARRDRSSGAPARARRAGPRSWSRLMPRLGLVDLGDHVLVVALLARRRSRRRAGRGRRQPLAVGAGSWPALTAMNSSMLSSDVRPIAADTSVILPLVPM